MRNIIVLLFLCFSIVTLAQSIGFTKEDTLIGSNTSYRAWWDVIHYNVSVKPDFKNKSISGNSIITYKVVADSLPYIMQIDLQKPLHVDSVFFDSIKATNYTNENNRWIFNLNPQQKNSEHTIQLFYHGKPKEAILYFCVIEWGCL